MKNICFFDIDGTLAMFGQSMSESTVHALHQLKENGSYIFINTGRSEAVIPQFIKDFDFDGYCMGCGISVLFHEQYLYDTVLDPSFQKELMNDLKTYDFDVCYEGKHCSGFSYHDSPYMKELEQSYRDYGINLLSTEDPCFEFQKFTLFYTRGQDIEAFRKKYENRFEFIYRSDFKEPFYEVVPAGYSKGNAIVRTAEALGIPMENCYAFGDSRNDLSMLKQVTHSIAMGNSEDCIKDLCEFVTHDCTDDGIEYACRHYHLI